MFPFHTTCAYFFPDDQPLSTPIFIIIKMSKYFTNFPNLPILEYNCEGLEANEWSSRQIIFRFYHHCITNSHQKHGIRGFFCAFSFSIAKLSIPQRWSQKIFALSAGDVSHVFSPSDAHPCASGLPVVAPRVPEIGRAAAGPSLAMKAFGAWVGLRWVGDSLTGRVVVGDTKESSH